MADTYTLPALTAADVNGIITAGQDGTYNITYTNLTTNQIQQIGSAFEAAMQTNLKSVALSGNYDDLENKPSASNLQGFHKTAFSGKASDLTNDSGFLTIDTNAYTSSPASQITGEDIENWNNKSNFSGRYNDLTNIPDNEQGLRYNFHQVAFTGDYSNLYNKPFIDYNIAQSRNNVFASFQAGWADTTDFHDATHTIGDILDDIIQNYSIQKQIRITAIGKVVTLLYMTSNNNIYSFYFSPVFYHNYFDIDTTITSSNNPTIILTHLQITKSYFPYLIYDKEQHVLYLKSGYYVSNS